MSTTFMNLNLPTVGSTIGPLWATQINTALELVDSHDHSSGKGARVPTAGININSNLSFNNSFGPTNLSEIAFANLDALSSTNNSLYVKDGDLYFNDLAGNQVRITAAGSINISSVGGIGGDYASTSASLFYTDATKTYTFDDSTSALANLEMGNLSAAAISTSGATDINGALTVSGAAAFNGALTIAGSTTMSGTVSFTGNTSGRGIVPVGAILPLMSNLAGITNVTATTAADANGYVVCGGQTISDVTSPMNGAVIPNINDSVFLMGSSTAGATGGSNTTTLVTNNLPSHTHTIDHGHSNTFALTNNVVPSSSHTHNMAHVHQWGYVDFDVVKRLYSLNTADDSKITIAASVGNTALLATTVQSGSAWDSMQLSPANGTGLYTTGALSPPTGSAGTSAATGTASESTTVTLSGSVTNHSGSSGSAGSGSSYDSRPSYITAKYIMRIK